MRYLCAILLFIVHTATYASEDTGKACLNIPERGAEIVKIENKCQKGDIIQLNKIHISAYCDFNAAIVPYNQPNQYICVYLGKKRELREGTN